MPSPFSAASNPQIGEATPSACTPGANYPCNTIPPSPDLTSDATIVIGNERFLEKRQI